MSGKVFFSLSEAARQLGKPGNRKLMRALIAHHEIPTYHAGTARILDRDGMQRLRRALIAWDLRPRRRRGRTTAPRARARPPTGLPDYSPTQV